MRLIADRLDQPLRWKKQRRVFVNSMSDLWHKSLPLRAIAKVYAVMRLAHWHTYQVPSPGETAHLVADSLDAVGGFGGADDQDSGDRGRCEYSGCRHVFDPPFGNLRRSLWKPLLPG